MKKYDEKDVLRTVANIKIPVGALQISEQLGIPPASAGRMLAALEEKGYLEKISNKGRVVTEKGKRFLEIEKEKTEKMGIAEKLISSSAYFNKDELLQILQTRYLLETYTAAKCAELAGEQDIENLKIIQMEYYYAILHGESGSEQDLKFHLMIAQIAGNKFIYDVLKLLLTSNNAYSSFSKVTFEIRKYYQNDHDALLDAIIHKDSERAEEEIRKHLCRVIQNVTEIDE